MVCKNCGAEIDDNVKFCDKCGAEQAAAEAEAAAPVAGEGSEVVAGANLNNKIGIIAVAAAALLVLIFIIVIIAGAVGSPKSVADKYLTATFKSCSAKAMFKTFPKDYAEYMADTYHRLYDDEDEMMEDLQDNFDDLKEYMKDEGAKVSWKISKVSDTKKDDKKKFDDLEDELDLNIKSYKTVKVKLTMKMDGDKDTQTIVIYTGKIGGKWYVLSSDFMSTIMYY